MEELVKKAQAKIAAEPSYDRFKDVLSCMNIVIKITEPLSESGLPGLKPAHVALSTVYEALNAHSERDENVGKLAHEMAQLWSVLSEIKDHNKIKLLEDVISAATKQTGECAQFLNEYADMGIAKRFITGYFVTDERISDLQYSFRDLKDRMARGISLQTWVLVERRYTDIVERLQLQGLSEASGASFNEGRLCLLNTRQAILQHILHWVEDTSSCGVYWVTGVAGCGKSTIAHTVAKILAEKHRLGASFFFDRKAASLSSPQFFCTTIAAQLARYNSTLRQAILDAIKKDSGIDAKPLPSQMGPLISAAVQKISLTVPLVIVMDALDESGTPEGRKEFLAALRTELPTLSAHVKILITSRDESDIRSALPAEASRHAHRADVKAQTQVDVHLYIRSRLADVVSRFADLQGWPSAEEIDRLAQQADGLFMWARVACDFILDGPLHDPLLHLEMIMSIDPAERALAESSLDALYLVILRGMPSTNNPIANHAFRYVVGSIVTLRDPLAPRDIDTLLGLEARNVKQPLVLVDGTTIRLSSSLGWIRSLASILSVEGPEQPVHIIHQSIFDFFVDRGRSQEFYIDLQSAHLRLVDRCVARMRSLLHHDICELQDPSKLNREIPDLGDRVDRHIPASLKYACRFWTYHLVQIVHPDVSLESAAAQFLSRYFLHWLEVMSLLGRTRDIGPALRAVQEWCKNLHVDDLMSLAQDGFHFVQQFRPVLDHSALHIYISGIIFSPRNSRIYRSFRDSLPPAVPVVSSGEDTLTATLFSAYQGHSDTVYVTVFFPRGDKLLSAGGDQTIHMWEPTSGSLVREPLRGHTDTPWALAVSSDGNLIASGACDMKVRLWNASTGQSIGEPLFGGTDLVTGVAFLSNDTLLASCSRDCWVRVWDVQTRNLVRKLAGRIGALISMAVSPDGKTLAIASRDSAELWSLTNWEPIGDPLHSGDNAVAFSPDSKRLALGKYKEHFVFLWNLTTKEARRLEGHKNVVYTVAFSPDGRLLVSGSSDNTIRLWNGTTGEVLGAIQGHTHTVWSLAFSPGEGTQLASASADRTVRIWDVQSLLASVSRETRSPSPSVSSVAWSPTSKKLAFTITNAVYLTSLESSLSPITSMHQHSEEVLLLVFSSDGLRLASASKDLLQWWDVEIGSALDGVPLKQTEMARFIAMSPDSTRLALLLDRQVVQLWNAADGEPIGQPQADHDEWIICMSFSPDGSWLATAAYDGTLRLRDPFTGVQVGDPILVAYASAIAFSGDGKQIAAGLVSATIRLWNVSSRELVWEYSGDVVGKILSVVFTSDEEQLISASENGTAFALNVSSGARVGTAVRCFNGAIKYLALSHDGMDLAVATDTVQIWSARQKDTWVFRQEVYPRSEMSWRDAGPPSAPFLASLRENPDGWLASDEGHELLWIPEHLRRVWSPFQSSRLRLGRDSPTVTLDMHEYLVWLSGVTGARYEVDKEWSGTPSAMSGAEISN
ncbi:WD40 repeat-like protein [Obba rivulosa]|uniref:WD40 repeat-like protein n=1 Tax=Obba rivulosa TaxID=1052685 RepID=A0A8E2ASG3_9APHY|nr:WD40 repeat-like protein [Obba rivulosa]